MAEDPGLYLAAPHRTQFSAFGQLDCHPRVFALRTFQQMTASVQNSAFAIRSTFTCGANARGATRNPNAVADGLFYARLGQARFIYRLPSALRETQIVGRVDTQLSTGALLSIEKLSTGGAWDEKDPGKQDPDTFASIGAGVQFRLFEARRGEFSSGGRSTGSPGDDGDGLQRRGMHLQVVLDTLTPFR